MTTSNNRPNWGISLLMRPFSLTGFDIIYVSQVFARRRLIVLKKFPSTTIFKDDCPGFLKNSRGWFAIDN